MAFGIDDILGAGLQIINKVIPDPEQRARVELELLKQKQAGEFKQLEIELAEKQGQIEVNKVEASHASIFVAGGRPAVIWVGAIALAWTFIFHPMLTWSWSAMQAAGWIALTLSPPPTIDADVLWVMLSGTLGIGAMRSFDKVNGKASYLPKK